MPEPTVVKEANRTVRSCIAGNMTKQAGKLITMGLQAVWSVKREILKNCMPGYIYRMEPYRTSKIPDVTLFQGETGHKAERRQLKKSLMDF